MAKATTKEKCFIIMPITTPHNFVEIYKDDDDHFNHVLEHLFIPAINEAGFETIPPKAEGSNVIHADIIKQLSDCELVLCDMSILNPNVFYEFGIRTALNKPVALVVDDKTKPVPFDTSIINFHKYDSSLAAWTLEEQKTKLTKHVRDAYKNTKDHNALWKYFGVAQTGTFKPEDAELGEKIDLIMKKLSAIETEQTMVQMPLLEKMEHDDIIYDLNVNYIVAVTAEEMSIIKAAIKFKDVSQVEKVVDIPKERIHNYLNHILDVTSTDGLHGLADRIQKGEIKIRLK